MDRARTLGKNVTSHLDGVRCGEIVSQSPEDQQIPGLCIDPERCDALAWCLKEGDPPGSEGAT